MYIFVKNLNDMETENKKPDNPFAFAMCDNISFMQHGMSLRDYFAAKAMQTYIQDHLHHKRESANGWSVDIITETAYVFADAMLKQREL